MSILSLLRKIEAEDGTNIMQEDGGSIMATYKACLEKEGNKGGRTAAPALAQQHPYAGSYL
jgi:hypothetical protein